MSTISASTTTTTAYVVTADTTGALVLQTGATPTTALTIDTSQNVGIGVTSPTAKLHITQTAASNALLVEDSANPDSSPFVIDSAGAAILGTTASATLGLTGQQLQVQTVAAISGAGALFAGWNATQPNAINLARSQSGTIGTNGIVSSGAASGIRFFFDDGTNFIRGAAIDAVVDGTPGTNDMPGRLVFSTTADGASTPTERMRITSATSENILFGLSASQGTGRVQSIGDSATAAYLAYASSTSQREAFRFVNGNGEIASFGMNGTSLTTTVGGSERMRIDSAGDVGIGTTTPVTKLEIAGNNGATGPTWTATSTSISGTTLTIAGTVTGTIAIGDLVFSSLMQPYTRITAGSGLSWTVSVSQTFASATVLGGPTYGNTIIRITETDTAQTAGQPTGGLQFFTSDSDAPTAGVGAYVAGVAEDTSPDTALVFGTRDDAGGGIDANERMRIDSSGNVGIGTTSISNKLHVSDTTTGTVKTRTQASTGYVDVGMGGNSGVFDTTGSDGIRLRTSGNDQVSIDTAGVFKFNSGYGSVATAYGCRAWVTFNGTGTVAITGSANVSSITDGGTGIYTVNFTNSMPDANYATVTGGGRSGSSSNLGSIQTTDSPATGSVGIWTFSASALIDWVEVNVSIFR